MDKAKQQILLKIKELNVALKEAKLKDLSEKNIMFLEKEIKSLKVLVENKPL